MTNVTQHKIEKHEFADFCTPLIGMPVSQVWRGHGSAVFFEFGKLKPTTYPDGKKGHPRGEMGLMVEWSWRIEGPRSIRCGSWSGEMLWEKTFAELLHTKVTDVSLFGRLPEIAVTLSNRLSVASFSTAAGQPHWTLFDRRKDCWLCVRRGSLFIEKSVKEHNV